MSICLHWTEFIFHYFPLANGQHMQHTQRLLTWTASHCHWMTMVQHTEPLSPSKATHYYDSEWSNFILIIIVVVVVCWWWRGCLCFTFSLLFSIPILFFFLLQLFFIFFQFIYFSVFSFIACVLFDSLDYFSCRRGWKLWNKKVSGCC